MLRRRRPWVALATLASVVVFVAALRAGPADPSARLPQRYRLADLIQAQQDATAALRAEAGILRQQLEAERRARAAASGLAPPAEQLEQLRLVAGLTAVAGPGLRVTLNDSALDQPPADASVNDLVIHSQDVQAVVNALWRAGAEAIAINGQRLVATSAVLCVGNTLLLNGTVHSPPYVVEAVGASRDRFDGDVLVRRLRDAAGAYGIRVEVERADALEVPAYTGSATPAYARPVTDG